MSQSLSMNLNYNLIIFPEGNRYQFISSIVVLLILLTYIAQWTISLFGYFSAVRTIYPDYPDTVVALPRGPTYCTSPQYEHRRHRTQFLPELLRSRSLFFRGITQKLCWCLRVIPVSLSSLIRIISNVLVICFCIYMFLYHYVLCGSGGVCCN